MSTAFPRSATRRGFDETITDALAAHPAWGSRITGKNGLIATAGMVVVGGLYGLAGRFAQSNTPPGRLPLSAFTVRANWTVTFQQPSATLQLTTWLAALGGGIMLLGLALRTMREAARWRQASWILANTSTSLTETLDEPDFQRWLDALHTMWSSDIWWPNSFTGSVAQGQHELVLLVLHFRQDTRPPLWVARHAGVLLDYRPDARALAA